MPTTQKMWFAQKPDATGFCSLWHTPVPVKLVAAGCATASHELAASTAQVPDQQAGCASRQLQCQLTAAKGAVDLFGGLTSTISAITSSITQAAAAGCQQHQAAAIAAAAQARWAC
jgi:hypothetical protein